MENSGIAINPDSSGGARVELGCKHQHGLLYVVPGNMNWVCTAEERPGHALAGFLKELSALDDPRVTDIMRRWGLYFRELPLEAQKGADER